MKMVLAAILFSSLAASCAHQTAQASDPKMEKMAQMHSDMAACLRDNKSMEECHGQMMASCKDGAEACPMMKEHMQDGKMSMMKSSAMPAGKETPAKADEHAAHHPGKTAE